MLLMILMLTFTSGCWDVRELSDLGITVALGLDKKGDEFNVAVQVVNPGEISRISGGAGTKKPVTVYEETGETITEAFRKILTTSPNNIYLSHVRVVVIGEELAKDRMKYVLDFISRNHEFRTDFFLIVAKDSTADTILKVMTATENVPANKIYESLEKSEELYAPTKAVTLDDLKMDLLNKGKQPVLTGIRLIGDEDRAASEENVKNLKNTSKLKYENLAVFKKDRLIGWLSEDESKGYNYLINNVVRANGVVTCPDGGKLGMNLIKTKTKLQSEFTGDQPIMNIEITGEGNIDEVSCGIDITKQDNIAKLEQIWNQRITSLCLKAVDSAQEEFQSDIFGFGEVIHRQHPRKWKPLKDHWDEEFKDLEVKVTTKLKIRRFGTITDSIVSELE